MAKKTTKVTETVTEEPVEPKVAEPAAKPDEEEPVVPKTEEPKKPEEKRAEEPKKPEAKVEIKADDDDDISYIKQTLAKQMIDSLDVDTLKKFVVECEGKSLKTKAAWIEKNKPVPAPDPSNGLAKGPAGGKPLGPYDPGYKHVFVDNRPKH